MKTQKKSKKKTLREQAEHFLTQHPDFFEKSAPEDLQNLYHELGVHQIELEMQNEELRSKQAELEKSRDRYLDLYDFAPVSYFIFNRKGRIEEVNLTGAKLLGFSRSRMTSRPFTLFLDEDSIALFLRHVREVFSSSAKQTCELTIRQHPSKTRKYVSLESVTVGEGDNARIRSAVIDITERRLAEEETLRVQGELALANERLQHLSDRLLAVQEEEKRRLALDVHDSFASSIAAIKYRLTGFLAHPENKEEIKGIVNQLVTIIDDARRIQTGLRPPILDDVGLLSALNAICREFRQSYPRISVKTMLQLEESDVSDPLKTQIFRITQEALSNIAKHSDANSAGVSLTREESTIGLVIQDNGRGFDVREALSRKSSFRGLGLSSMKERATLSGGTFRIESAPGKGTTLMVSWPLTGPDPRSPQEETVQ